MDTGESVTEEWWIVFCNAKYRNILYPFLQNGYQHVYAMKKTEAELMWHIVNPMRSHIHLDIEAVEDYPHPRAYAGQNAVIIPVKAIIDTSRFRGTLGIFNCVEVVKGLLGIKAFWIWTPYQLFKYLRGQYGRDI